MTKPTYVLGTGLSHNGSSVLIKNGEICVGIEKERLTRQKHDGGNDMFTVQYCLDAEGIKLKDLSLVVQCANFEIPDAEFFNGRRHFNNPSLPFVSISHHLAHAHSAISKCPYNDCNILIIDGCGSLYNDCIETFNYQTLFENNATKYYEKDSLYHLQNGSLKVLHKDFSELDDRKYFPISLPTTKHSIGGFYNAVSQYIFGNMNDAGKLMGLAPYGKNKLELNAFEFINEQLFVTNHWKKQLTKPYIDYDHFKLNFQYYADIALWAQTQVEKAILKLFSVRSKHFPHENWCYAGGVALNAVANTKLSQHGVIKNLHVEPASNDAGIALGCAIYGWTQILKEEFRANNNACYGRIYNDTEIKNAIKLLSGNLFSIIETNKTESYYLQCADYIIEGKTIGWFQKGSEFGPRALGHRSILAHPGISGLKGSINCSIKKREDFRPFAPAVLEQYSSEYFTQGFKNKYMLFIDEVKSDISESLMNITHVDKTARVQVVTKEKWNDDFYRLLKKLHDLTGLGMVLNTSFNKKATPIVETPKQAVQFFKDSKLDILILENYIIKKLSISVEN